jgi:hypothetical protein
MSEQLLKEQENRIEELTNELAALKLKAEEDKIADATRDAVKTADSKPAPAPSVAVQNMRRKQAIGAVGGPAFWSVLPLEKKVAALGLSPITAADAELSKRLFGPNSSSLEASRLQRQNPTYYSKLRALHSEL